MTKEEYNKAKRIISVLERIDRVLSTTVTIHNNGKTVEHSFKPNINSSDLCVLAQTDVDDDFLKLLYEKKLELENKLKEL